MKRYRVATWLKMGTPIPFIFNNKPYTLEMKRTTRIKSGCMDIYFIVTDGKDIVKFDWREVKTGHDLDANPDGVTIYFCENNRALNKVAKWLDEQVLKDKEMIDIDDMIIAGKRPNVLRGKVKPDWYDAREELPRGNDNVLICSREGDIGIGYYEHRFEEFVTDNELDGTIKGWMYLPDAYDWRANTEACEYDEEYQQELEDAHWDAKIDEARGK